MSRRSQSKRKRRRAPVKSVYLVGCPLCDYEIEVHSSKPARCSVCGSWFIVLGSRK